jgi:hypothetical protein
MRSQSAWSSIDLAKLNASYDALEVEHIAALPLARAPVHYSREKYVLNASCGVPVINVHGVYEVTTGLGVPGQPAPAGQPWPEPQLLMDPSLAYHFHFVNVGRDRSRDRFVGDRTIDARAQETIRAQLDSPRGVAWARKKAALKARKRAAKLN